MHFKIAYNGFIDTSKRHTTRSYPLWFHGMIEAITYRQYIRDPPNGTEWMYFNEIHSRFPDMLGTLINWSTRWHSEHSRAYNQLPPKEQIKRVYYQVFCMTQYHPKYLLCKANFFVLMNRMNGALTADYAWPFFSKQSFGLEVLGKKPQPYCFLPNAFV